MGMLQRHKVIDVLLEDGEMGLYRIEGPHGPLLLRMVRSEPASPRALERLANEWDLSDSLDPAWALKPLALERHALELTTFAGVLLSAMLGPPMTVARFLPLAVAIAAALEKTHGRGIVHLDLNPNQVLVGPSADAVRLTGFGLAARLPRTHPALPAASRIDGDLAYISPEQTGRTSWAVDVRSDLYALGVVFYQLLTGELPCEAEDALGWVQCHVAKAPVPPTSRRPDLPPVLADIVLKLLAKLPADRYQTARGLRLDLERCRERFESADGLTSFELGAEDVSDRFELPRALYGREAELMALEQAYERVVATGRSELTLVTGAVGIGKTALVQAFRLRLADLRGYYSSGKYDQYKRGIPYAIITQALDGVIQQLLTESDARIATWKERIQGALGLNGQLVIDVVPRLALLIGPQPDVAEIDLAARQSRFNFVFQRFLGALARPGHPLVIFLDDLQWSDAASIKLVEHLLSHQDSRHLFVIGAYRDTEIGPAHPLHAALQALATVGPNTSHVALGPLAPSALEQLMQDLTRVGQAESAPLARLVHEKTGGNPFFLGQFLTALHEEGLLTFDGVAGSWRWDMARIQAKGYTDNVADLMVSKLRRLPEPTLRAVQVAAACGHRVDQHTLAAIGERSELETRLALRDAEREGLMLKDDRTYVFLHDRIQQAAYSSLPEAERAAVHLQIGRQLVAHTPIERLDERLFEIVAQLNHATTLIEAPAERLRLAELNLAAGRKALASTAFEEAIAYFTAGVAVLDPEAWTRRYELAFALHFNLAESRLLNGAAPEAEHELERLLGQARDRVDAGKVTSALTSLLMVRGRYAEAIAAASDYLARYEIALVQQPSPERLREAYDTLRRTLGERRIEDLATLPAMEDREMRAALAVMVALIPPAFVTDPGLSCMIAFQMADLSLRFGNAEGSYYAYTWIGVAIGAFLGEYADGYRFGRLGLDMVERGRLVGQKAKIPMIFGAMINPWTQPHKTSLQPLREAFQAALELGDLLYACSCCHFIVTCRLAAGDSLEAIERELEERLDFVRKSHFLLIENIMIGQQRLVRNLRGLTRDLSTFDEAGFEQAAFEGALIRSEAVMPLQACWYFIRKLTARYLSGDFEQALEAAEAAERTLHASPGFIDLVEYHAFAGLALAARDSQTPEERQAAFVRLRAHIQKVREWARHAPGNYGHRQALLSAELARLNDAPTEAERLYEEAITGARQGGFVQHEGIACELAARFYRDRGLQAVAETYLRAAQAAYMRWGALGKVRQLEGRYPLLVAHGAGLTAAQLDLMAVLKASQAISREIELPRLMETLMRAVIEGAGAERGYLLLPRDQTLWVESAADASDAHVEVAPAPAASLLPSSILAYVARTRESVLLEDASSSPLYGSDPYIVRHSSRSVLCLPIVRGADLVGMLFLENAMIPGAFTPARLAVIEHLAAQAAISLQNARLYADLAQENAVRRQTEAALRESEARIRSIVENSMATIYLKDLEGRYLMVNRWFATLLHKDPTQIVGKTDAELFGPAEAEAFTENDRKVLEVDAPLEFEEEVAQADHVHTYVSIKFPLHDEAGRAYAVCGISTDITERKRAAEEIARKRSELVQAIELDKLKSEFVHAVSHELRTPLTAIKGYVEFLEDGIGGPLNKQQLGFVKQIDKSAVRLELLANDLVDYARMDAGTFRMALRESDLAAKIREVAATFRPQATYRQLTLTISVPDTPVMLTMDPMRIEQVLNNLVGNAIKFAAQGGRVEVRLRQEGDRLLCEVEDTGAGIAPEDIPKLFQRFSQLKSGIKAGGTGLGLSISKAIVEAHGGQIGVYSTLGAGSTFWFSLPLTAVALTPLSERP